MSARLPRNCAALTINPCWRTARRTTASAAERWKRAVSSGSPERSRRRRRRSQRQRSHSRATVAASGRKRRQRPAGGRRGARSPPARAEAGSGYDPCVAVFNPFLPSFLADPYPAYAALRAGEPVHYSPALQAWVLTGYEECERALRDHAAFSSDPRTARGPLAAALERQRRGFPLAETPTVLNSDPPAHARLRGLLNRAFTPRAIESLGPRIEGIAASLLADAGGGAAGGRFDLVGGFARPLPIHRNRRAARRTSGGPRALPRVVGRDRARHQRAQPASRPRRRARGRRRAGGVHGGDRRAAPPRARGGPDERAAGGGGGRRAPLPRRADRVLDPAAAGRARDHHQPDRQRRPRAGRTPGAGRAPARRSRPPARGRRGAAALRRRRAGRGPLRAPPRRAGRARDRRGRRAAGDDRRRQPRPAAVRRSRRARPRARAEPPPRLRARRPLLPRRAARRLEGRIAFAALLGRFPRLRVAAGGAERGGTLLLRGLERLELET